MIYLNTKTIKKVIPTLRKISPTKTVLKSIQNIRMTAHGQCVTMSATDLRIAAQCNFDAPMGSAEFDVLVNAKQFCTIIRSIKSSTIGFDADSGKLTAYHHAGHIHFPTQSTADFPDFLQEKTTRHLGSISADFSMIAKSIGDSTADSLCQVAIEQDGTIAATNGYTVGIIKTDDFVNEDVFLDGDAVRIIASQLNGDIAVANTENKYILKCNNWAFWIPRASGKMPNYRGVIPHLFQHNMYDISVHELLYHVAAASKVNNCEVELSINDAIEISAESFDGIKWDSRIDVVTDDSEISIMVDPNYLVDALTQIKKISATATLRIAGDMRPMSLPSNCGTYQSIIMPLRPMRLRV